MVSMYSKGVYGSDARSFAAMQSKWMDSCPVEGCLMGDRHVHTNWLVVGPAPRKIEDAPNLPAPFYCPHLPLGRMKGKRVRKGGCGRKVAIEIGRKIHRANLGENGQLQKMSAHEDTISDEPAIQLFGRELESVSRILPTITPKPPLPI